MDDPSRRREETVEIEGKRVELLVSAVPLERPELGPPRHSSVPGAVLVVEGVVQEHGDNQSDGRGWEEDGVQEVIELQNAVGERVERVSKGSPGDDYKKEKKSKNNVL